MVLAGCPVWDCFVRIGMTDEGQDVLIGRKGVRIPMGLWRLRAEAVVCVGTVSGWNIVSPIVYGHLRAAMSM